MIQWGAVDIQPDSDLLRRRFVRRREARRIRVRDNRIALGVFLLTMGYLTAHLLAWVLRGGLR